MAASEATIATPARYRGQLAKLAKLAQTAQSASACTTSRAPASQREGRSSRRRTGVCRDQARLKIRVPFVPPNPKEFDSTARIVIFRAARGT